MAITNSIDLEFASSQTLSITDAAQTGLDLTGSDATFEVWTKFESVGGVYALFSKGSCNGGVPIYKFDVQGASIRFLIGDTSTSTNASVGITVSTGIWYHLAVAFNDTANTATFYQGTESTATVQLGTPQTITESIINNADDFILGGAQVSSCGNVEFDGLLNLARAWSDVRTVGELESNKFVELGATANLVSQWVSQNSLNDSVGSNNLTNNNGAVFVVDIPVAPTPASLPTISIF